MKKILIVGGASLDILHFSGQTKRSPGGAGMYTAMAARRSGLGWLDVGMFSPKPDPMPETLQPVAARLSWLGPQVAPDQIPRLEIEHNEHGTTYLDFFHGAELTLDPTQLPADLSQYAAVHVIPLGDAVVQLSFVRACRERGAEFISAGCAIRDFADNPEPPTAVFQEADALFLNEGEANILFGSLDNVKTAPGKLVFVTLGDKGAMVVQGDWQTRLTGNPVVALDPTGAGDTFCGGTLAYLTRGEHPVQAARLAMPLAAEMVQHIGPTALISDVAAPLPEQSPKVRLDPRQIERVAQQISALDEVKPHDFLGPESPALNDPGTVDLSFALTLQQFSFWTMKDDHYHEPLIAPIDGKVLKGSAYISQSYL
ncbi:MAG: sugar/nucleoside kinase (ribokinase family), partial [Cellvibrionaceae bacterium]